MPETSYRPKSFVARRVFAGRSDISATFRQQLQMPQALDDYRVLVIYGPGGQGKSRLCRELITQISDSDEYRNVAWAHVDFENALSRQPEHAMLQIRVAL